ncbi:MAG: hypothetical protein A2X12_03570 [Bacteroidetes bacterium GWE2_29_8]|nr:MAG: hypothetical protein A2X12_03570 [Bacteroidetes bacterium GWE2_29_8]
MIKNIIFDFGVVLIDIDTNLAVETFKELGISDFDNLYNLTSQSDLFNRLETGDLNVSQFCEEFRFITRTNLKDEEIKYAWNKVLLDIPKNKLAFLESLKKNYKIFLLSNTNKIHIDYFNNTFSYNNKPFSQFFDKEYYSYKIGLRKPNLEIYNYVLTDANILAEETLFVDDNKENISSANLMGIKTFHFQKGENLENISIAL